MRVEGLGQARQIDLQQLAGVDLVGLPVAVAIADRPLAHRLGVVDIVDDLQGEQVELDLLAQPLVGLGLVGRIVDLVGIVADVFVDREVVLLLEQLHRGLESLILPHAGTGRKPSGRSRYCRRESGRRGSWPSFLNSSTSRLQEVVFARIEILDEIVAPLDGDLIVDGGTSHMPTLEQIDDDLGGLLILGLGNRSLSPDDHRHQGQDRDQHQRT